MQLIINGYFDIGFSIGIDDYCFSSHQEQIKKLSEQQKCPISFTPSKEAYGFSDEIGSSEQIIDCADQNHIGLNIPIGNGLLLKLIDSDYTQMLFENMIESAENKEFMGSYYQEFPSEICTIVKEFIANCGIKEFNCRLYGLGIGSFYIETPHLPLHLTQYALWIYRCLEYACYGTFCDGKFRNSFRKMIFDIYTGFDHKNQFRQITRRKIPNDFFPGFQCILMNHPEEATTQAEEILCDYDELTAFKMDDGKILFGWAAVIIQPRNTDYVSRITALLSLTQVYYGICDGFEKLFAFHISESVRDSIGNQKTTYDAVGLNRLRTISHTVAQFTRFDSLTQNISDLKLLRHFDELGGFTIKLDHMSAACEIFTSIMNEKIEQNQSRREKRLNMYAMALTALTIVSVLADMLSISEFSDNRGWGIIVRIGVILVIGISAIYFILEGRGFFKKVAFNPFKHRK